MELSPNPPSLERPTIDFRRVRDASGVINASFGFLRENWRGLLRATLYIVGPIYLFVFIIQVPFASSGSMLISGLLSLAQRMILLTVMQTVIVGYMLLYAERGRDGVTLADLRAMLRSDVAAVFGVITLSLIASLFASALLLIPGIYLFVATSLGPAVRMAEESTVMSAISRSIDLVRGRWWQTFGIFVLVGLVALLIGMIVQLPSYLLVLFAAEQFASTVMDYPVVAAFFLILLEGIATVIASLIIDTTLAIHYFNLVEQKEGPGMIARIAEIGVPLEELSTVREE